MGGTLMPQLWFEGLDAAGVTLPSSALFFYDSGTSTKRTVYTDAALTIPHPNPLPLDSAARAVVYLPPTAIKVVWAAGVLPDPPSSPLKTVDPVNAVPGTNVSLDVQGTAGETLLASQVVYLADSTGIGGLTPGRWYKASSATAQGSSAALSVGMTVSAIATGVSGSIRLLGRVTGLAGLTPGVTYYIGDTPGTVGGPSSSGIYRVIGIADTSTSIIMSEKRDWGNKRIIFNSGPIGNIGAGEDILFSDAAQGNTLYADNMGLSGRFYGATANNANVKNLRFRVLDGVNNALAFGPFAFTVSEAGRWVFDWNITRWSATQFLFNGTCWVGPGSGPVSRMGTNLYSPAAPGLCTWGASTIELRLTGDATATDDIVAYAGYIDLNSVRI